MIVVGVVLIVLALLAAIGVFAGGTAAFTLAIGSLTWATNSAQVFLTGAAVMIVLLAGAQVTWIGWKRRHRQNKDVRSLRRTAEAAGISTAPAQASGGPDRRTVEPTADASAGGAPATVEPAAAEAYPAGETPGQRPDPGDEIRTRPLEREHRGDTER